MSPSRSAAGAARSLLRRLDGKLHVLGRLGAREEPVLVGVDRVEDLARLRDLLLLLGGVKLSRLPC